jgi:hypothetical protein
MSETAERIRAVREEIAESARKAGRSPDEITLMGVTKNQQPEAVQAAIAGGLALFGENRVQEAEEKYREISGEYELHLIGHLQRNKAKRVPGLFSWVQSIDAVRTVNALDGACVEADRDISVLLEVNISGEEQKYGVTGDEEIEKILDAIGESERLSCRGLMGIAPWVAEETKIRSAFAGLRERYENIKARRRELPFDTLSMGMSGDFAIAVEEGSTLVRIGTAIFGSRGY